MARASATITDHTPLTDASDVPPQRSSARKLEVNARQNQHRHHKIDDDHYEQRQRRRRTRWAIRSLARPWRISAGSNVLAVVARSRKGGSPPPHSWRRRPCRILRRLRRAAASARASHHRPKAEHDGRGNDAQAGCGERRGAEERHRDSVLDRRRSRQRGHRECRSCPARWRRASSGSECSPRETAPVAIGTSTKNATNRLTPP